MVNMLIHSCIYEEPAEKDRDGNIIFSQPVTLERVRIVPVLGTIKAAEGESKNDKLTLYYSPEFSSPEIVPLELSRITWNGAAYTIRSVQPCYTNNSDTIHHYEAALV